MKKMMFANALLSIILLCTLGGLPGCGDKEQSPGEPEGTSGKDVKEEVKEAYDTTKAYTREQVQSFREETESKLAEYSDKIDQLEAKTEELGEDAKAKAQEQLQALRQKRDAVSDQLKELGSSSADAWEQIKSGINNAMEDLGKAYDEAAANFSEP